MLSRLASLTTVGLLATAVTLGGQQQAPVFRAGLATVAVPTMVFTDEGGLVTTLTRDDFTVFDEGRRQEITNFISGFQPITAVVLIDTSASMTMGVDRARAGAEHFLVRLRPGDKAQVGVFSNRLDFSGEFTDDRDKLIRFLGDLPFGNPTRLFDAIDAAITALLPHGGRRVIVPFTDGCDTASTSRWDLVRARLRAEDILIYPIQVRSRFFSPPRSGRGVTDCVVHSDLELPKALSATEVLKLNDPRRYPRSQDVIEQLGSETGGGRLLLSGTEDLNATFTRLLNELHYTYLLGFSAEKADGKMHELRVKVKDPALVVRARRNYQAPLK